MYHYYGTSERLDQGHVYSLLEHPDTNMSRPGIEPSRLRRRRVPTYSSKELISQMLSCLFGISIELLFSRSVHFLDVFGGGGETRKCRDKYFFLIWYLSFSRKGNFCLICRQEAAGRNPRQRAGARPHPAPAHTLSDPLPHSRVLIRSAGVLLETSVYEIVLCFETKTAIRLLPVPVFYEQPEALLIIIFAERFDIIFFKSHKNVQVGAGSFVINWPYGSGSINQDHGFADPDP